MIQPLVTTLYCSQVFSVLEVGFVMIMLAYSVHYIDLGSAKQ